MAGGVTVKDVSSASFIKAYSAYLKRTGKIPVPKWVDCVKTGAYKEMPPHDPDWFFTRVAAVARQVYLRQGVGVGGLNKRFGGKKRRGNRPNHSALASGSINRKAFQALEKLRVLEKLEDGGRRVTREGQRDLDLIATQIVQSRQ